MRILVGLLLVALSPLAAAEEGWTSLFNGKDLTGWKAGENAASFAVKDGAIVTSGPSSMCFYMGDFHGHKFKDFELKVDVMTLPGANGGVFIDTEYQEKVWPAKGFEVQVNNSYVRDPVKTGSLYHVKDSGIDVAKDNQWFTEHIIAKGDTITIRVDDKVVAEWTQPAEWSGTKEFAGRRIAAGTIGLQAHDPGSVVYYKNIRIKVLD